MYRIKPHQFKALETGSGLGKGTYILLLRLKDKKEIQIGRLGLFEFRSGYYTYVGSAFGPGGLAARLKHHCKKASSPHWHIDYFRKEAILMGAWISDQNVRKEHAWAHLLQNLKESEVPAVKFGSSDCKCKSHLFYFKKEPFFHLCF